MNDKKIIMEINLDYGIYEQIKHFVDNYNENINIGKSLYKYATVDDFIIGSIMREIDSIKNQSEVFCELKTRGVVRPIKLKNNFRDILKSMGLKQIDLEEMTGIGGSDISNYLNNRRMFSIDHFLRIWIALGNPDLDRIFYVDDSK